LGTSVIDKGSSSRLSEERVSLSRRLKRRFVRVLTALAAHGISLLPLRLVQAIGAAIGWIVYLGARRRCIIAEHNLQATFGNRFSPAQRRRIIRRSCQNIATSMLELFKFARMRPEDVERLVTVTGAEHLHEAAQAGRGVIVVTAHYGNWELLGSIIVRLGYKLTVVARDASDPVTASLINSARNRLGMKVVGRDDLDEMLSILRSGGVLGVLPDQRHLKGGRIVEFMGRPALTAVGPAVLALRSGAAVVPGFARRVAGGRFEVVFYPPVCLPKTSRRSESILACTKLINEALGKEIAQHPEQWLWLHDRWTISQVYWAAEKAKAANDSPQTEHAK